GRDPWRTPMQWDTSRHAGFTSGQPWLPLEADYREHSVANLRRSDRSILWLYRRLIALRPQHPALSVGATRIVSHENNVLVYERTEEDEKLLIAFNCGQDERTLPTLAPGASIVVSTSLDRDGAAAADLILRGDEGLILQLAS